MAEKPVNQLPQMTMKKMGCDALEAIRQKRSVFMCRIYGEASARKVKESRQGDPYAYLIGEFRGETEEAIYESGKLFLPGSIMEAVEAALVAANGEAVQFAYDIYSTEQKGTPLGYAYAAKALIKSQQSNRLGEMESKLADKTLPSSKEPEKAAAVKSK